MITEALRIVSQFINPGILLGLGLCCFFLFIPKKAELQNYRIARRVIGCAYIVLSISLFASYYSCLSPDNFHLSQFIALTTSILQAFLFTYTLITLINLSFVTKYKILRELILIGTVVMLQLILYIYASKLWFLVGIYLFTLFYVFLLIRYVILFRILYRDYLACMDDFFSDEETHRLHWVSVSFYASLLIGILAIPYSLFLSPSISLMFEITVLVFYTVFGIRFINYVFVFQTIETAMVLKDVVPLKQEDVALGENDFTLMGQIDALMEGRQLYKKADISIEEIASILSEKSRTISETINLCRKMNFKTYVNEYRIKEAVHMLSDDKQNRLTIDAVAYDAGFTDRSNFYRVFKKHKGVSPTDFRKHL